jgi:hypothetical protein
LLLERWHSGWFDERRQQAGIAKRRAMTGKALVVEAKGLGRGAKQDSVG